jgi:hypothetical protein
MTRLTLPGLCVVLAYSGFVAASAAASPIWLVAGSAPPPGETVTGAASNAKFKIAGMTTTCSTTSLEMKIKNVGAVGEGEITDMSFLGCSTDTKCTVEAIGAENLPWPLHLKRISNADYVVVEGIEIVVVYGNEECVLYETEVVIDGSAGGLFTGGSPSSLAFSPSNFTNTGTKLLTFGTGLDWSAIFSLSAPGGALSVG